ncbi:type II secretion system protein GspK [Sphingomonas bacterium]|uniref:type II secretion system protein GspK n=1 Tax=Sphingomonas bacterium TaxID=1895847 RepID=UPI0015757CB4|nr:type II secretion system protein GspK [Sphingomonas bacterium]
MTLRPSAREEGLVLVNVLLMVVLASGLVAAMLVAQNASLQRSQRLRDAASADAALAGAELSAIGALRRDAVRQPESDDLNQSWARIGDRDRAIAGGTFSLVVADAQAKFNVNTLARGDSASRATLASIVDLLRLPPDVATRIAALLKAVGPISSLAQLGLAGVQPAQIAKLAAFCTVLPPAAATINVNTADERLLGVLVGDQVAGRLLANRRARQGFLARPDFIFARTLVPSSAGFASDFYWVRGSVSIGGTRRGQTTLLRRDVRAKRPEVVPISRWIGGGAPLEAPPSP